MTLSALRAPTPRWAVAPLLAAIIPLTGAAAPAGAAVTGGYTSISGAGSSYAAVAIDQWSEHLRSRGIVVNYNPIGSAAGRTGFIQDQYDFAASDVPFRNGMDQLGGTGAEVVPWSFSYIPAVADGISFLYHLNVHGHLIRHLRLSGATLMKIFTGAITNWDNPQITRDNGTRLPDLPITQVVHSDGAGTTYYFSRWMATVFPRRWNAFCERIHPGIKPPCGPTEFYPTSGWGNVRAENGSNNVADYITSKYGNGAIGYDEYGYALSSRYPVARLRNPAGKYVLPTAVNVTAALTAATIDENPRSPDYLQENLNPVYTFRNPESYPLSSYSYFIVPATPRAPQIFKNPPGKGRTLTAFLRYALCRGQAQMSALGYAPLPANLVAGGLRQINRIPGHGRVPVPDHCGS